MTTIKMNKVTTPTLTITIPLTLTPSQIVNFQIYKRSKKYIKFLWTIVI